MLAPGDEVVHLLDLDPAAEPLALIRDTAPALLDRVAQIFVATTTSRAPAVERRPERALRPAVHRRRVDETRPASSGRADDRPCEIGVAAERPPRAETDDGAETPLFHHGTRLLGERPAANAAAKKAGSSSGPRPMCESGRPSQTSRQCDGSRSSVGGGSARRELAAPPRCDARPWSTSARVGIPDTRRDDRSPAQGGGGVHRLGSGKTAVAKERSRADDAGPIAQTAASMPRARDHASAE